MFMRVEVRYFISLRFAMNNHTQRNLLLIEILKCPSNGAAVAPVLPFNQSRHIRLHISGHKRIRLHEISPCLPIADNDEHLMFPWSSGQLVGRFAEDMISSPCRQPDDSQPVLLITNESALVNIHDTFDATCEVSGARRQCHRCVPSAVHRLLHCIIHIDCIRFVLRIKVQSSFSTHLPAPPARQAPPQRRRRREQARTLRMCQQSITPPLVAPLLACPHSLVASCASTTNCTVIYPGACLSFPDGRFSWQGLDGVR